MQIPKLSSKRRAWQNLGVVVSLQMELEEDLRLRAAKIEDRG